VRLFFQWFGGVENLEPILQRVLMVVFDPLMDPVRRIGLRQRMGWNRVDDLVKGYIADIEEVSGGFVRYQVVERKNVNDFPVKSDGFRYTAKSFADVTNGHARAHDPDSVNYHQIVESLHLLDRVGQGEIDEVWLFGFPYAGFYESRMAGQGAFWCNAPPLENTEHCPRRFVIMGLSYERGVGEMLEDLGHRTESVMEKVYETQQGDANLWKRFTLYDQAVPGRAEVGTVHYAPNSQRDYDWGNRRLVSSGCDQWLLYPHLNGARRQVNCAEWGNGDIRLHHKWWLAHLPKTVGDTDGIANNWWRYVIRVDDPIFDD
jgi:hypothetical protein